MMFAGQLAFAIQDHQSPDLVFVAPMHCSSEQQMFQQKLIQGLAGLQLIERSKSDPAGNIADLIVGPHHGVMPTRAKREQAIREGIVSPGVLNDASDPFAGCG
jgi:hypothetical protein